MENAKLCERVMDASNTPAVSAYETKLHQLEHEKALMVEERDRQVVPAIMLK